MRLEVRPGRALRGRVRVPGDKSISHRALILAALAAGTSRLEGLSPCDDVRRTAQALRALGVEVVDGTVRGGPWREPEQVIDLGNSATSMRLLSGALSARPFLSVLTGDASLRRRPMERVAAPLRAMGAQIWTRRGGLPPLAIRGGSLRGISWELPVASAQVKTALLLAALEAEGETRVREPLPSRDHTERLFEHLGLPLRREGDWLVAAPGRVPPFELTIPGDPSCAAFLVVGALLVPGSELRLEGICLNPTRTGFLEVLERMGARVEVEPRGRAGGEPWGDLLVRHRPLRGVEIAGELIPRTIDELPVLAVAACFAGGRTVIRDAAELRVKESDRIAVMVRELRSLGGRVEELPDGMVIEGGSLRGGAVSAHGDHRVAMALGVAGLACPEGVRVEGAECVEVSFPGFVEVLRELGCAVRTW